MTRHIDYSHLSDTERLMLAQELIGSVVTDAEASPLTPDQVARVRQTLADLKAGTVVCTPLDTVMRRLRKQ